MSESLEDQVSRLRQMADPTQQTWDLSKNDQEAIAMAVRIIDVIEATNPTFGISVEKTMIDVELRFGCETFNGQSLLECFDKAGRSLE